MAPLWGGWEWKSRSVLHGWKRSSSKTVDARTGQSESEPDDKLSDCLSNFTICKNADLVRDGQTDWLTGYSTGWLFVWFVSWNLHQTTRVHSFPSSNFRSCPSFFYISHLNTEYHLKTLKRLDVPFCLIIFGEQMELHLWVPHWCGGSQLSCWVTRPCCSCRD